MRLVLIGDIHAGRKFAAPWQLVGKRLVGMANMWFNRHRRFDLALLDHVLAHASTLSPDLILFSGDLSTTALEGEFADVATICSRHHGDTPIVMVPGNHDRYTFAATVGKTMERHFGAWMPPRFPHLQSLEGAWHLLALDAAVPRFGTSRGRIGRAALAETESLLASLPSSAGVVVLCHYPVEVPPSCPHQWGHCLADATALRRIFIRQRRRTLFLHGHIHLSWCMASRDPMLSHLRMINAGSPTHASHAAPRGQGFWHLDLPDSSAEPVQIVRHEPGPITGRSSDPGTWHSVITQLKATSMMTHEAKIPI